jgi:hypothetical protein
MIKRVGSADALFGRAGRAITGVFGTGDGFETVPN